MQVDVGQLLFVLDTKSHSIVPAQVDEVLVSKTVKGETVQHKLIFPNGKKAVLEKMTAPWFTDISGAKLIKRSGFKARTCKPRHQRVWWFSGWQ